jgi:hypothetical protein
MILFERREFTAAILLATPGRLRFSLYKLIKSFPALKLASSRAGNFH